MEINLLEATPLPPTDKSKRVAIGTALYNEILQFYYDEADLLGVIHHEILRGEFLRVERHTLRVLGSGAGVKRKLELFV